eukprot:CAMPEP_0184739330 /NCGR_PEP_ID=MMETSP0315-20130426/2178_1 /TAXON_ID=101924 /ORGANISM="Rhodosorus marinus, Strain UTEX LB 2760" /LENGTH=43 /DNA_ID= /DNA_START= /DNA_END= /DNA_ORIENTATION=
MKVTAMLFTEVMRKPNAFHLRNAHPVFHGTIDSEASPGIILMA